MKNMYGVDPIMPMVLALLGAHPNIGNNSEPPDLKIVNGKAGRDVNLDDFMDDLIIRFGKMFALGVFNQAMNDPVMRRVFLNEAERLYRTMEGDPEYLADIHNDSFGYIILKKMQEEFGGFYMKPVKNMETCGCNVFTIEKSERYPEVLSRVRQEIAEDDAFRYGDSRFLDWVIANPNDFTSDVDYAPQPTAEPDTGIAFSESEQKVIADYMDNFKSSPLRRRSATYFIPYAMKKHGWEQGQADRTANKLTSLGVFFD